MSLLKTSRYTVTLGHAAVEPQSASHTCPAPPPAPPPAAPPPVTQGGWSPPDEAVSCNRYTYEWDGHSTLFHLTLICTDGSVRDGGYFNVSDADLLYYLNHGFLPRTPTGGYFG